MTTFEKYFRAIMNIKLIKAELEKLSLLLTKWDEQQEVSAIERDIALDKLKSIYNEVQFATPAIESVAVETPTPQSEPTEEENEPQVEVELLFDDEMQEFILPESADSIEELVTATVAAAVAENATEQSIDNTAEPEATEPVAEPEIEVEEIAPFVVEEPMEEIAIELPAEELTPEEPKAEEKAEEYAISVEEEVATPNAPAPIVEEIEVKEEKVKSAEKPTKPMDNLFGLEEVRRQPRSKHQRMMSIYNDVEPQPEKVVDISKIFDIDIDDELESFETTVVESAPKSSTPIIPIAEVEEAPTTLGEAIAAQQTLADTLEAVKPLAEEIHQSQIKSLRDGIGLNDKFLMIRDLFDGDGEAYEQALSALDEQPSYDDCMIYIIENYEWNPDSEGSKFIMQLLERKHL